jgi:hypothetical protein
MKFVIALVPLVHCSSTAVSLREFAIQDGPTGSLRLGRMRPQNVFRLGLSMLDIVEDLHKAQGMNHRHATASSWFMGNNDDPKRVELGRPEHLRPISKDLHGFHRIVELQQLVLTLRYLIDLDERFYSIKTIERPFNIQSICSGLRACPFNLRDLVQYALLDLDPGRGSVPHNAYDLIRSHLTLGLRIASDASQYAKSQVPVGDIMLDGVSLTNPIGRDVAGRYYATAEAGRCENSVDIDVVLVTGDTVRNRFMATCFIPSAVVDLAAIDREAQITNWVAGSNIGRRVYKLLDNNCLIQDKFTSFPPSPMPMHLVADIGIQMVNILERLHNTHRLVHQNAILENWVLAPPRAKLRIINYSQVASVDDVDPVGDVRLSDLKQVALNMLNLLYQYEVPISFENLVGRDPASIFSIGFCPPEFRDMITFVLNCTNDRLAEIYGIMDRALKVSARYY